MQFELVSPTYKSTTTVDVGDDVQLILLNGDVFERITNKDKETVFSFIGVAYDWNAEQAKKPRRAPKEDAPKLNGLPTFPAAPSGTAEATVAADSISRSVTQGKE